MISDLPYYYFWPQMRYAVEIRYEDDIKMSSYSYFASAWMTDSRKLEGPF